MAGLANTIDSATDIWLISLAGALVLFLIAWYIYAHHYADKKVNTKELRENYVLLTLIIGGAVFVGALIFYLVELGIVVNTAVDTLEDIANAGDAGGEGAATAFRNYATGIAALLAALAASVTLAFQLIRVWINERTAKNAEQGLITDRINKAVEGLGAERTVKRPVYGPDGINSFEEATEPNLEVRVGAVLALERISKDSPDDHIQIMEILCAYIRENACIVNIGSEDDANWQQRVDTQTAITVIGRRDPEAIKRERGAKKPYFLDLRYANLQRADMSEGNLANAQLQNATLVDAKLDGAKLQEANLGSANLQEAILGDANLQEAVLRGANLQGAILVGANLQEAVLGDANLQEAVLGDANLQGAILVGANLQAANLGGANLQGADLVGANLQGAILWSANLQGAVLRGANLQGAILVGANLQGADLGHANLQEADLGGANLQGADLWSANLQGADLVGANLKSTDLTRSRKGHTRLRSVDFTGDSEFDRESLDQAFGVKSGIGAVKLPDDDHPSHWHAAEETSEDAYEHELAFLEAYEKWAAANPLPED